MQIMQTTKTKTAIAVGITVIAVSSLVFGIYYYGSRSIRNFTQQPPAENKLVNQNQSSSVTSDEVTTSCDIDSGATGGQNAIYHATFTAYGKMENGVKKTKVVSTGQVYTMVGLNSNGAAVYKLIDATCDSGYVSGKAQCNYSVANVAGQGPVGTATGEIIDNEAGGATKNLLINVGIGTDSEQRPYNKCTKYTALTGLTPVPTPTPTPGVNQNSDEVTTSCDIDSGATGGQNAIYHATFTAYGKMENGVKKTKVVSTGQVYTMVGVSISGGVVYKLVDATCDSGYVSGKAQCNYSVADGAGQGSVGTATGEIVDNEAGATTKNLLINVAIGHDSNQQPFNKCTKYTALTGLTQVSSPITTSSNTQIQQALQWRRFDSANSTRGSQANPWVWQIENGLRISMSVEAKGEILGSTRVSKTFNVMSKASSGQEVNYPLTLQCDPATPGVCRSQQTLAEVCTALKLKGISKITETATLKDDSKTGGSTEYWIDCTNGVYSVSCIPNGGSNASALAKREGNNYTGVQAMGTAGGAHCDSGWVAGNKASCHATLHGTQHTWVDAKIEGSTLTVSGSGGTWAEAGSCNNSINLP
jgi:hypothetical protein